jgi:cytidyltransferase-like protein
MRRFRLVALAGTFDHLHKGHEMFISQALKIGDKALIGLMSDEYLKKKLQIPDFRSQINFKIQNFQIRKKTLEKFLRQKRFLDRAEIIEIDDLYGPAIKRNDIEALIVTRETLKRGRLVNKKRKELGLKLLKIIKVPLITAEDKKRISSMRIRLGEIDRRGKIFMKITKRFSLSEETKQRLKKPQGIFIKGDPQDYNKVVKNLKKIVAKIHPLLISTVGDEVTKLCNEIGIKPHLAIFDYKVNRKIKYRSLEELGFTKTYYQSHSPMVMPLGRPKSCSPADWSTAARFGSALLASPILDDFHNVYVVRNPPGCITMKLIDAVRKSYKRYIQEGRQQLIKIIGEDDLSGVPAILLAPLGSVVIYGQPYEGIVVVSVTEEKKSELVKLLVS